MKTKKITLTELKTLVKQIIKEERQINEISSDTFRSAVSKSDERDTTKRSMRLGKLYFNKFIGKPLMNSVIDNVGVVGDDVYIEFMKDGKKKTLYYDIETDKYSISDDPIERKDAVILSKIAQLINPDTKYKETSRHFKIKGN